MSGQTQIMDYLKAPESNKPSLNLLNKGLLRKEPGEPYLCHQCQAHRDVQIEMLVSLAASEQLVISTRYQASRFNHPWMHMDPAMPVYCSLTWELALKYRRCRDEWSCPRRQAHITNLSISSLVTIDVVRYLGRSGYTGKNWYRKCQCLENHVYVF